MLEPLWQVGWWILLLALPVSVLLLISTKRGRPKGLPPGPYGLPLVGFLPFLSQKNPHLQLNQMRKRFGDVFGMYMGSSYYLILGDLHSVREAFNMAEFTCRPDGAFQVDDNCANFASTSGQHWTDHRRLAAKNLRHRFLNSEKMESTILQTVGRLLDRLDRERSSGEEGQVVLREAVTDAVNQMSFGALCTEVFPEGHEALKTMKNFQEAFCEFASSLTLERFLPWLKPLLFKLVPSRMRISRRFKKMETFCWSVIEARERDPASQSEDYIDCYLAERKKPNMEERFTRPDLNGDIQMMMFASGDTVRATIEWFLLVMAKFPEVQERMYREIYDVLGSSGQPSYEQRSLMPYTEAAILESMRYITLVPLNPMHSTVSDKVTNFRGHDIPAGSVVIANLWAIHNEPKNWSHPDQYHPEHFLTPDGGTVKIPDSFVPFGVGKRICIGDKYALAELYLLAVSFLQRFQVLAPKEGVSFEPKEGITIEPSFPRVRLLPRRS